MMVSQHTGYSKSTHTSRPRNNQKNTNPLLSKSLGSALSLNIDTSAFDPFSSNSPQKNEPHANEAALTSQELLNVSMHDFNRLGYGNGENAYKSHEVL